MKFLFIVQGEGRGHLTQALTLEDYLQQEGHEVVKVLVGEKASHANCLTFSRDASRHLSNDLKVRTFSLLRQINATISPRASYTIYCELRLT